MGCMNVDESRMPKSGETPPSGVVEVPVTTRRWCTLLMVPCASFMSLAQLSFRAQTITDHTSYQYIWMVFGTFVAILSGLLLLRRNEYPLAMFLASVSLTILFPFDSLLVLMAMTSLLARRTGRNMTPAVIVIGTATTLLSQIRDALQPAGASLWHAIFAVPNTGGQGEPPLTMMAGEPTIVITAIITSLAMSLIAVLLGLHIRSRATLRTANAKADAAVDQATKMQDDLNNQQLADAIAAEAHDTLAHSLSLLALNASALQAEASKLAASTDDDAADAQALHDNAQSIATTARDIRQQAAGALDEAHSIIDMLRHPEQARVQLAPSDGTSLTRDSLDALIGDARAAGMRIDTWIDIQQLSALNEHVGKVAYRSIQEGLTNARRHAQDAPVSLQVDATPAHGVHIHISNPCVSHEMRIHPVAPSNDDAAAENTGNAARGNDTSHTENTTEQRNHHTGGSGLKGVAERVQRLQGICRYGFDDRQTFHLDVRLPWLNAFNGTDTPKPAANS